MPSSILPTLPFKTMEQEDNQEIHTQTSFLATWEV